MLHLTTILIVCCAVSAPSEGIAVIKRNNYPRDDFCAFDSKLPNVAEFSPSVRTVNDDKLSDCGNHKLTNRPTFFYNFVINRGRKNSYCSIMDGVLKRRIRKYGSSGFRQRNWSPPRKRNLLWTQKGIQSLKTLKPTDTTPPTSTLKPIQEHTLNFIEKKRLLALKRTKVPKKKRVRRYTPWRRFLGRRRSLRDVTFNEPTQELVKMMWDIRKKIRPRSYNLKKFHELNRGLQFDQFLKNNLQNIPKEAGMNHKVPHFRHTYVSNKDDKNGEVIGVKNFKEPNSPPCFDFLNPHASGRFVEGHTSRRRFRLGQFETLPLMKSYISNLNRLIYESGVKKNSDTHDEIDREAAILDNQTGDEDFNPRQGLRYISGENEVEESDDHLTPETTLQKPFLQHANQKDEVHFNFPNYDEIQKFPFREYAPVRFQKKHKYKLWRGFEPRYLKTHNKFGLNHNIIDPKRSALKKMERPKKSCCSKCDKSCGGPHKCWKSAPLLCIPYIRKGQDDLLNYLIKVMQRMLGKPYPQKIDIFENTKFKPCVMKKPPSNAGNGWDDIIPHDPDEDDDNDDTCKTTPSPCDPCPNSHPVPSAISYPTIPLPSCSPTTTPSPTCSCCTTPPPCPCSTTPPPCSCPTTPPPCSFSRNTPCPPLFTPNTNCCSKNTPKKKNGSKCSCLSCPLPNLNRIYTETTPCISEKCFSTLPSFLFPPTSIQLGVQNCSAEPTLNPTKSIIASIKSTTLKSEALVPPKASSQYSAMKFFTPKKIPLKNLKKSKDADTNSLAVNDQLQPNQKLNDKMLSIPEFMKDSEELGFPKLTKSTTAGSGTSCEPFLFELPNLFDNEKQPDDADEKNNLDNQSKNPTSAVKERFNPALLKERMRKNHRPRWLPTDDETQIDRPFRFRRRKRRNRKYRRYKREDNYSDEDFVNYGDLETRHLERKEIDSGVNNSDNDGWTPLKYEMFEELAKLVMATENMSSSDVSSTALESTIAASTKEAFGTSKEHTNATESELTSVNNKTYNSQTSSTFQNAGENKLINVHKDLNAAEDDQMSTTLGFAHIVKGSKKQMTKPSPKIYAMVYPDSVANDYEKNHATVEDTTDATSESRVSCKTTTAAPDIRLRLLAVCEGYLEIMKLMKSQNQSFGEDLDRDISLYCESIISQSFSQQADSSKSKKQELDSFEESESDARPDFDDPVLKRQLEENKKSETERLNRADEERDKNIEATMEKPNATMDNKLKKDNGSERDADDDEFLKKGMTKEQLEMLHLLKKRKKSMLGWLFNPKENQIQPEQEETEYFGDSVGGSLNFRNSSGPVRQRGARRSRTTPNPISSTSGQLSSNSGFPIYAKQYGYDKGGEVRQVEVLWRKMNEKTHEKKIFKNMSVLAVFVTSTVEPTVLNDNKNLADAKEYVNEDVAETRTNGENYVGFVADGNMHGVTENTTKPEKRFSNSDGTITYMNKPHPSSLIGVIPNGTDNNTASKKHPNISQRISNKLDSAKGVVQGYTMEFWNYVVYILPIMFSILFLSCFACFAFQFLKNKQKYNKKKKKKKLETTDEDETTEETDSEPKKKKRFRSKKLKNVWKVWKRNPNKTDSNANNETEPRKKKNFLKFLKKKKNKTEENSSVPYSTLPESDEPKADVESEAAERRELISLLEELKKIEMEQIGEKKDQKSVHVQYMTQDFDEAVLKRTEIPKRYPLYSKRFPFREPDADDYGIDAELGELLPCECGYFSKKHNCLRHSGFLENEGQCERLFKIFRNTGKCDHLLPKVKNFPSKGRDSFDKYKSADTNDETNEGGFTDKVCDLRTFNLPANNANDWVRDVEHYNRQIMKKKHVRLKDDGVLCRL